MKVCEHVTRAAVPCRCGQRDTSKATEDRRSVNLRGSGSRGARHPYGVLRPRSVVCCIATPLRSSATSLKLPGPADPSSNPDQRAETHVSHSCAPCAPFTEAHRGIAASVRSGSGSAPCATELRNGSAPWRGHCTPPVRTVRTGDPRRTGMSPFGPLSIRPIGTSRNLISQRKSRDSPLPSLPRTWSSHIVVAGRRGSRARACPSRLRRWVLSGRTSARCGGASP